ncbi:TonB-dependent receptor family protein [Phreatobacter sp.]|uniref:TonB-dependent receptor family protein n=1 Tax=Phreatobacter sp. TaxID=1966341 RepID=UPI003F6F4F32
MSRFLRAILAGSASLAALVAATPPASAQDPTQLPAITIEGTGVQRGSLTSPDIVTQREQVNRTPGSVSHIDTETLRNTYAQNLRDVLQETPGVLVQNRYSQEIRLSIRGSGLARSFHARGIEVLQDGIPTMMADGSGDFYQIEPRALRAIEVFRGGNALPFGSSTMGGAINFVTPTARTAVSPNAFSLEAGSFGTIRGHGSVSRVYGDWDVHASGTLTHADGWRAHETQNLGHFNANVGRRISDRVETRFYFGAYYTDQKLPGALTYGQSMTNPRQANAGAVAGDQARNTYVQRFANVTSIRLDVGQIDITSWAIHKHLNHPIFQVLDQDGWTYGISPRFTGSFSIGGFRNDIVAGARIFAGSNAVQQFVNLGGAQRGALTVDGRQNAENYEAWFENRFFVLPTVALTAGAKVFSSRRAFTGGLNLNTVPVNVDTAATYSGVNPRIGVLWEPMRDVQLFANVTRSADVPDFTDLMQTTATTTAFVPLRAQTGTTFEVGTRGRWGRFTWEASFYRAELRNQMLQFNVGPGIPAATFNAPQSRLQGIELAASVDLFRGLVTDGDRLTFRQMWTWSDFRFSNDPVYGNNVLPLMPRHILRSSLTYAHPSGITITPTVDIVPEGAFVDYQNTFRVPGYALFGIQASARLPNGGEVFVDLRNLTDKRYIADFGPVVLYNPATTATFYPGTGRSLYGGVRMRF